MRFKIIICGRNVEKWVDRCLASVASQKDKEYDVCIVDDASTDGTLAEIREAVAKYDKHGSWQVVSNVRRQGAMYNQVHAIRSSSCQLGDVIVFLDLDDYFPNHGVLTFLRRTYTRGGYLLTYGQYTSNPYSATCTPAVPYPEWVVKENAYRRFATMNNGGMLVRHLRTIKYDLFVHLDDDDFRLPNGQWFPAACDTAMMIPCLELAGGNYLCITKKILYVYNSENPNSDWRVNADKVNRVHRYIFSRKPKDPLEQLDAVLAK